MISLPHTNANGACEHFCQLNCGVNINQQNMTIMMEEAIVVALLPNFRLSWSGSRNGYRPASPMSRPLSGSQNQLMKDTQSHCLMQNCSGWFYAAACCWSHNFGWLNSVGCCWRARKSWWFSTAMEMRTVLQQSNGRPLCGKSGQGSSFKAGVWSNLIFV